MRKTLRKLEKVAAMWLSQTKMPKAMSEWFDRKVENFDYIEVHSEVDGIYRTGKVMKSGNCLVVLFPNWNCDAQTVDVANRLRKLTPKKRVKRQNYW